MVISHPGALLFLYGMLFSEHVAGCTGVGPAEKSLGELRLTPEAGAQRRHSMWCLVALGLLHTDFMLSFISSLLFHSVSIMNCFQFLEKAMGKGHGKNEVTHRQLVNTHVLPKRKDLRSPGPVYGPRTTCMRAGVFIMVC